MSLVFGNPIPKFEIFIPRWERNCAFTRSAQEFCPMKPYVYGSYVIKKSPQDNSIQISEIFQTNLEKRSEPCNELFSLVGKQSRD